MGRTDILRVLNIWTESARALASGSAPLADLEVEMAQQPSELTITCGFGPGLFEKANISEKKPTWLKPLPPFKNDALTTEYSGGDVVLQICSHNATSVAHAVRVLARGVSPYADIKWSQQGFLSSPEELGAGHTPRNLFGFKDGTVNPRSQEEQDHNVWISRTHVPGQEYLAGGTSMVVRRVHLDLDDWDILDVGSREIVFGREQHSGAPLGQEKEDDPVDVNKLNENGLPCMDPDSHVALAEERPGETTIFRRGYNYDFPVLNSTTSGSMSDSGLIFICFQNNPETSFIPIQQRLSSRDRLNQWIKHIGSAVFYCPSGTQSPSQVGTRPDYWGSQLFT